jgi:hypothetical protein
MSSHRVRSDAGGDQRARACSNAVILAHYYRRHAQRSGTPPDYLGDALGLSRRGAATDGEGDRLLRHHSGPKCRQPRLRQDGAELDRRPGSKMTELLPDRFRTADPERQRSARELAV